MPASSISMSASESIATRCARPRRARAGRRSRSRAASAGRTRPRARLAALEQVAVALVRLLGRREAGVLADRPRPAAVHVRVRAARERELAGRLELEPSRRPPCRPASPRCRTRSRADRSPPRRASYVYGRVTRTLQPAKPLPVAACVAASKMHTARARAGPDVYAVGAGAAYQAVRRRAVLQLDRVLAARAQVEGVRRRDVVRTRDDRGERVAERAAALGRLELVRADRADVGVTGMSRRDRVRRGECEHGAEPGDDCHDDSEEPERAHVQPSAGQPASRRPSRSHRDPPSASNGVELGQEVVDIRRAAVLDGVAAALGPGSSGRSARRAAPGSRSCRHGRRSPPAARDAPRPRPATSRTGRGCGSPRRRGARVGAGGRRA